ncbi:hypothetical protein GGI43DRAFT_365181 [Trichoderma evansii]
MLLLLLIIFIAAGDITSLLALYSKLLFLATKSMSPLKSIALKYLHQASTQCTRSHLRISQYQAYPISPTLKRNTLDPTSVVGGLE